MLKPWWATLLLGHRSSVHLGDRSSRLQTVCWSRTRCMEPSFFISNPVIRDLWRHRFLPKLAFFTFIFQPCELWSETCYGCHGWTVHGCWSRSSFLSALLTTVVTFQGMDSALMLERWRNEREDRQRHAIPIQCLRPTTVITFVTDHHDCRD